MSKGIYKILTIFIVGLMWLNYPQTARCTNLLPYSTLVHNLKNSTMQETFKTITDFSDYQVSNLGNVISLKGHKGEKHLLKLRLIVNRYYGVTLYKNKKAYQKSVHRLVYETFEHKIKKGYTVDHINNNGLDNNINNLQELSHRQNISKETILKKKLSKYVGVYKDSRCINKWKAIIHYNGKNYHLGSFDSEIEAHVAYQNKLKEINK